MAKHKITNLRLREISTVDRPAQIGALAVLIKSREGITMTYDTILKSAAAVVATGADPAFTVTQYEDAMFARAAELGKELGCSPEQALAKSLSSDPALRDFAAASEVARCGAYATEVRKRHAAAA